MLILGQRNDESLAREFDWFASKERLEISPASIWIPDEDETLRRRVTAPTPPVVEDNSGDQFSPDKISPQVSVHDEDSFAKPRALPEITPHVSVRDEDSFAKPAPVPEITPHVSFRDEDSFATPSGLPEIHPHVSFGDEDSFAKPSALPEIHPHVSFRDEDSFAKPIPLPEINPHVSIRDDAQIFSGDAPLPTEDLNSAVEVKTVEESFSEPLSQTTQKASSMQESKVLAGEPSFVTVTFDGERKKTFVQEYISLGSSRTADNPQLDSLDASQLVVNPRPVLDEPGPGSTPKVHVLHEPRTVVNPRPVSDEPRPPATPTRQALEETQPVVYPSPVLDKPPSPPMPTVQVLEETQPVVTPRVKVLDESQVLPGEASFATAIPGGPSATGAHSPLEEFLAKTNLDLRTLMLASLLFVSILAVSALVIMEATTGIYTAPHVASATAGRPSQSAESAMPQYEALSATKPIAPVAISKPSKQESQSMAPPREYSKFPGEVTKPMSLEGSNADLSRKAHSNDVRAEKADKKSAVKSGSREATVREHDKHATSQKSLRASMKESAAKKKVAESRHSTSSQKRAEVNKSSSRTTARKPVSASAKDATITKPKVETKVPSASNGAQRPRTVTRASGPGQ